MESIETPAYIVNKSNLETSITSFISAQKIHFENCIFSYSLKTNSLPYILDEVNRHGGFAEVVSSDEYELARLSGFSINNIVYNGPLKSKATFLEAIQGGAIVNIETTREIEWLDDLSKDNTYPVGIRVNIDLALISPDDAKDDEDYSRFGFSAENSELDVAINKILSLKHIKLTGFHVHRTTLSRAVSTYKEISLYIGKVASKYSLDIAYVDIGGGFYGIMDGKPSFEEYFLAVKDGLSTYFDLEKITVIFEPGNAIVASAVDFITSVIDVKKVRDFYLVTTDGSRNDIDPFYKKSSYFHHFLRSEGIKNKTPLQIVAGGTCLEYDKIFEVKNEDLLKVNDRVVYKSVGAYTMTLSPLFIRFFPNVYLSDGSSYQLLRKKWSASDFFDIYKTN